MKQIPEDLDSERSLLATLCAPGAEHAASLCVPALCGDDFMHPNHRAIFEALREILEGHEEVNPLTLRDALVRSGRLDAVGGYSSLMEILNGEEVGKPMALVGILIAHRRRREILRLAGQMYRSCEDATVDPDEVIGTTQEELHRIGREGRRDEGEGWDEILHNMASFEPFRRKGPERMGWWGIPTLDQVAPIPGGEFVTVGARPGVGKTALASQIAVESARKGIAVLVVSLELPRESMRARLASYMGSISMNQLKRGDYTSAAVTMIGQQADTLAKGRIQAPLQGTPWPKLEAMIRYEVDRHGIQLVILDQFDKIGRPGVGRGSTEAYAFGAVSTGIMALCKDLNIGFVLLCQLKGDAEGREPTLADHADSDRPGKDASVVVHLWRTKDNDLKARIQKNRDGSFVGKRLDLDFKGEHQRFHEIEMDTEAPARIQRQGVLLP